VTYEVHLTLKRIDWQWR